MNLLPLLLAQPEVSDLYLEPPPATWQTALIQYVVVPLLPVMGTLLVALLGKAVSYLHSKERESKLNAAFAIALEGAKSVVLEVEQTLVPKLQTALADGVLTDVEKAQLKAEAMNLLKARLPEATMKVLSGALGGLVESFLSKSVESAVSQMKKEGLDEQVARGHAAAPPASPQ